MQENTVYSDYAAG